MRSSTHPAASLASWSRESLLEEGKILHVGVAVVVDIAEWSAFRIDDDSEGRERTDVIIVQHAVVVDIRVAIIGSAIPIVVGLAIIRKTVGLTVRTCTNRDVARVGDGIAVAVAMGYMPSEGDTVPRRRLRQTEGSRGDIAADGTTFTASAGDPLFGRWDSNIQRALDTSNDDDTAMADGSIYNIAFAVHTGMVTVRDHYVSFGYTLSLGGGDADIQAVKIAGSGSAMLPDFSDSAAFPVTELNTFLPGIASYEFLNGDNAGLEYIDPETGSAVDQNHGGSSFLLTQGLSCRDCHTVSSTEPFNPPNVGGFPAGAMELLVPQRGGVNTPTPIPAE